MERYGLTLDQAVEHIKQVSEDEAEVKPEMQQEVQPPASKIQPSEEEDQRQLDQQQSQADITEGSESGYEDRSNSVTGPATTTMGSD
jgi:hypothetical protein